MSIMALVNFSFILWEALICQRAVVGKAISSGGGLEWFNDAPASADTHEEAPTIRVVFKGAEKVVKHENRERLIDD